MKQHQTSKDPLAHAGDCTIYAALMNDSPIDGICTCGYGWSLARKGDWSEMYSRERLAVLYRRNGILVGHTGHKITPEDVANALSK